MLIWHILSVCHVRDRGLDSVTKILVETATLNNRTRACKTLICARKLLSVNYNIKMKHMLTMKRRPLANGLHTLSSSLDSPGTIHPRPQSPHRPKKRISDMNIFSILDKHTGSISHFLFPTVHMLGRSASNCRIKFIFESRAPTSGEFLERKSLPMSEALSIWSSPPDFVKRFCLSVFWVWVTLSRSSLSRLIPWKREVASSLLYLSLTPG